MDHKLFIYFLSLKTRVSTMRLFYEDEIMKLQASCSINEIHN